MTDSSSTRRPRIPRRLRGRQASAHVALVMITVALVSASLVGAFNYAQSRTLLQRAATDQLVDLASNRADLIERSLDGLRDRTAVLAVEPTVSSALVELSEAYDETDDRLDGSQLDELRSLYEQGIEVATAPGVTAPSIDELLPSTATARYLQFHYIASVAPEERPTVTDPGDGSTYSAAHAVHHPRLRSITDIVRTGDVVLVDIDGTVVYSEDKRIDFGTSLTTGPHAQSGLAEAASRLETAAVEEVVVVDYQPYLPAGGRPEMWVATVVRAEDEIVGIIATSVDNEALLDVTTAAGDWDLLGLGDTGEVYVVGPDRVLRSESRLWLEDPEQYLQELAGTADDDEVETVRRFRTTVLTQTADTEPVRTALRGEQFEGTTANYLGRRVSAVAMPVDQGGLGWILVVDAATSEIFAPLADFVWRLAIIALLGVPLVVAAAVFIARRMLRPVEPLVAGVQQVVEGDIDVRLGQPGHDEFADLASQLDLLLSELRRQRDEIERTDRETTELLASIIPRRLLDEYRSGARDISRSMRNATLVACSLLPDSSGQVLEEDELAHYSILMAEGVHEIARRHDAEQIAASAARLMFATGLESEELETDRALAFALEVRGWVDSFIDDHGIPVEVGIGVAAGDVVATVVSTERIAFDIFGTPRHTAEVLALGGGEGVIVDAAIAGRMGGGGALERVDDLRDARGTPIDGWRLRDPAPSL